jgi:phage replication-related protein YjqB (UPF0714/DUF867 family)
MRHVAGESNREIARAEGRDRETVARIVKSSEMAGFVEEMKEEFRGLVPDAINAIRYALQVQKDARIALEVLRSNGLAPRSGEPEQLPITPATKNERDARQIGVLAAVIAERRRVFNVELPADMEQALADDEADHPGEAENRD